MRETTKPGIDPFIGVAIHLVLLALIIAGGGCAPGKTTPDPLIGWHLCGFLDPKALDPTIIKDYRAYVETMPAEEKRLVDDQSAFLFDNEIGQHAIRIEIGLRGVWVEHLLIYDKDNKRIKAIRYSNGRYAS